MNNYDRAGLADAFIQPNSYNYSTSDQLHCALLRRYQMSK